MARHDSPPPDTTVPLAFREFGSGPPLLILHGLFGSAANWSSMARRLGDRYRVLCLELRNHGNSPHAASMRYEDMVADVRGFMDYHALDSTSLLGHSMGGKVAMGLALESPGRVEKLIVVDIAPVKYDHSYRGIVQTLKNLDLTQVKSRADAAAMMASSIPEEGLRQFLLQSLASEQGRYRWRINLDAVERYEYELTGFPEHWTEPFAGEALFVRGALSGHVVPEHYPLIRRLFPGAKISVVAGAGHWLHVEQPQEFLAAILPFLQSDMA